MSNYNYVAHACAYLNQDIGKLHFIYVRLYFEIYTTHFMNWDGGARLGEAWGEECTYASTCFGAVCSLFK